MLEYYFSAYNFNPFSSLSFFNRRSQHCRNLDKNVQNERCLKRTCAQYCTFHLQMCFTISYHQLWLFFFLFCWVCLFVYFCIVLGFFSEKYPVSVENFWLLSVLKEKRLWHISTLFSALLIVLNHFAPDKKNTKYHSVHISSALSTLKCFR